MPHLLIVGNSVSEAPVPEVAAYPARLTERLNGWTTETFIGSGKTVDELEPDVRAALAKRPAVLVLQVGINECAPRPLNRRGRTRLGGLRPLWLRDRIIWLIHLYRPRIIRARRALQQFTPPAAFAASVRRILEVARAQGCETIILPITRVTATAEARTPFTNREAARYNTLLRECRGPRVHFVEERDLFGERAPDELCITPDSVHLNDAAHEAIASYLASRLAAGPAAVARGVGRAV